MENSASEERKAVGSSQGEKMSPSKRKAVSVMMTEKKSVGCQLFFFRKEIK